MKVFKINHLVAIFLFAIISSNQAKSFCQVTTDTTNRTVLNEKRDTNPVDEEFKKKLDTYKGLTLEKLGYIPVKEGVKFFNGKVSNGKNMWADLRYYLDDSRHEFYRLNLIPAFRSYKDYVMHMEDLGKVLPDYVEMVSNKQVAKQLKKLNGYRPDITEKFTKEHFVSWYNSATLYDRIRIIYKYINISGFVLRFKNNFLKTKLSPEFTDRLFTSSGFFDDQGTGLLSREKYYNSQLDTLVTEAVKLPKLKYNFFEHCDLDIWGVPFDSDENLEKGDNLDTLRFKNKLTTFFESKRGDNLCLAEIPYDSRVFYYDGKEIIKLTYDGWLESYYHYYRLKDGRWIANDRNRHVYTPGIRIFSSLLTPEICASSVNFFDLPCLTTGYFIKKDRIKDKSFYTQLHRKCYRDEVSGQILERELYYPLAWTAEDCGTENLNYEWKYILADPNAQVKDYVMSCDEIPDVDNFDDFALVDGFDYTRPSNGKPYTEYRFGLPYEELAPLINKAKAIVDAEEAAKEAKKQEERERENRRIRIGMPFADFRYYYNYKVVSESSSRIVVRRNNTYYYFDATGMFGIPLLTRIVNY